VSIVNHRFVLWLSSSFCLAAFALGGASCGARTDLGGHLVEEEDATGVDHKVDGKVDAHDAADAPPDIVFPDVPIVTNCADAGTQYIYVITEQNELFSFFPPTLGFTKIGDIACNSQATPFSMGVDRSGIAYSVFTDGNLFQISTLNAACKSTTYKAGQSGITTFGMGFSGAADAGETLYIAGDGTNTARLGSIDTTAFKLNVIGPFQPQGGGRCELTGTGDGRLFAFCLPQNGNGSGDLVNLDPQTAKIISEVNVGVGSSQDAFAYAFYGGLFYIFTGSSGSTVTTFDPITLQTKAVASLSSTIVGAGVSTCAPEK
jgi:hypothetical protein